MELPIAVGIAVALALVLARHVAARRVVARQGQFVWLMFVPTLIGGVVIVWAGIQMLATVPVVGVVMAIGGALYLGTLVRFLTRLSRSVTSADPRDDLATAISEPLIDYTSTIIGVLLIVGLIAVVGLIAWGVSMPGR